MSVVTVDDVYSQAKLLTATERQHLFSRLLEDIAPEPPNTFYTEEELRQLLHEGLNSGPAVPFADSEWDEMRREVRARAARRSEKLVPHA